jgi:cell wall assembly regulator SMI1
MAGSLDCWIQSTRGWRGGEVPATVTSRRDQVLQRLERVAAEGPNVPKHPPFHRLSSLLRPPATPDQVMETEHHQGIALPEDYVALLLRSDGASLTDHQEAGSCTIDLLGTAALVRCAEERAWDRTAGALQELVVFATIGSDGDCLAFETGRMNPWRGCAVLDARPAYRSDQWWVICRDFTDWLNRVLTDPGPPGSFGRHWEPMEVQPVLPIPDLPGS